MNRRMERVANLIRNTIGQIILGELSDPRIDAASTSVTRVEVPEDFLTAKVFVSVAGTAAEGRRTLRALRHAAGHVQELMMREISLRHTPVLEFVLDETFKKTLRTYELIQQAMDEIRQAEQSAAPDEDAPLPDTGEDAS